MDIEVEDKKSYLYVRVSGSFDLEEAKKCLAKILDSAVELGIPNLLIDGTLVTGNPTVLERYTLGEYIAGKNIEHKKAGFASLRLAAVGVPPVLESGRLTQLVARNRSANIFVTDNIAEAVKWLGVG